MIAIQTVPNTNGNYFVASNGAVFSRPRQGNKGGELKQRPHNHGGGYMCVDLRIGGEKRTMLVHIFKVTIADGLIRRQMMKDWLNFEDAVALGNRLVEKLTEREQQ